MLTYHYIQNHREQENDKLFSRQCDNHTKIHWQLKGLTNQLKEQNQDYKIEKLGQLRQSRISIWVKEHGLRKAQYLAGFKQVSTVEEYQTEDLENLQEQINIHHPLQ